MSDVVVTCPKGFWREWIEEGDAAHGDVLAGVRRPWHGELEYGWNLNTRACPSILPGQRVYVVAHGRLRGYSPLVAVEHNPTRFGQRARFALVRRGDAVAVTIPEPVKGFQGFRYRWWERDAEVPFPDWRTEGVK
jgi:hypothetical protein